MGPRFLSRIARTKSAQISLGLLCTFLVFTTAIFNLPGMSLFINRADSLIYDLMIEFYHVPYQERARVVIIDIDDVSIQKEGRWPWPRDKLAKLISKLQEAGVVVTAFDVIMADPEINYAIGLKEKLTEILPKFHGELNQLPEMLEKITLDVDNDEILAIAMRNYDVVLGFLFHDKTDIRRGLLPQPLTNEAGKDLSPNEFSAQHFKGYNASLSLFIKAARHGGFVTNLPDPDGVIRQGLVIASIDNKVYPSLALRTVMRYLLADHVNLKFHKILGESTLYGIDVGGVFIPTNSHGQILIPYWGPPFTLPFISAADVLEGKVPQEDLAGGVAIVGSSTLQLADLHPAPVAKVFPGVEMVGNMVTAMLGKQISTKYDWNTFQGISLIGIFGVFFALVFAFSGYIVRLIVAIIMIFLILGGMVLLFVLHNLYVPTAYMLSIIILQVISNYLYEFFLVTHQKHVIRQLFGQYVPENYIKELLDSPEIPSMEGQSRNMTVLFSDIRSFTTISEGLDAISTRRLLNTFFTPITEIIYNQKGTIDKYVGDMVMAFWGAPIPIPNNGHTYHAIMAALDIFKALPSINESMINESLPSVNIGIGLGTGLMNVGDMGSKYRRSYTVLGDVVNLGSRLESLTKFYGVNILVNDLTFADQEEFFWRIIDKVEVKGRHSSLSIYEPLGLLKEATNERIMEVERYHQALNAYYAQDWEISETIFDSLNQQYPQTHLYRLYLERIARFKEVPPSKEWNGVFVHLEK